MKRAIAAMLALLLCLGLCACGAENAAPAASAPTAGDGLGAAQTAEEPAAPENGSAAAPEAAETAEAGDSPAAEPVYDGDTKVWDVIRDPVFAGYGRLLFPQLDPPLFPEPDIPENLPLKEVYMLLPSYHCIRTESTVDVLNALHAWAEEGRSVFLDLYSEEEKAADPAKEETGLFFFPGEPGGKTAVYCPGQAFKFVGAIHDGFPHALELSRRGYNCFVLIYRPGAVTGCEDLARAISLLFDRADELQIDMTDYSLWGGASGGRLATWICERGTAAFGGEDCPKPAAEIMQYCAIWDVSVEDAPTYINVGKRDKYTIVNIPARVAKLDALGVDTELEQFEDCAHGFGLGIGTSAEGWIERAIAFWERHMSA